ncbi:hypothetical protein [Desulfovibrio ferrophilus]|uniref:Diaminopimelate epimerase n=1 Tax=Desulfovibrio ferrophilus TaxID=241368 RepID=A0A2Z6AYJ0_9BACT|nr:hypothetical protein [Desulfovibrio ferrophilus]BBD08253.1 diaminopimelate epimerase [Desulfovibrio ferrophilus]
MSEECIELERWSVYGNDLLFLDALTEPAPAEAILPGLAKRALASSGSDSLILLQTCSRATLQAVNDVWSYWDKLPSAVPDAMVRIFEPDGSESLSCGNGLLSAASLLLERGVPLPAHVLTGLPSPCPWIVEVGTDRAGRAWLRSGTARRVPPSLADPASRTPVCSALDRFSGIFPGDIDDLRFPAELAGYLVLTGEPHLVVMASEWKDWIPETPTAVGRWLDALGRHLNLGDRVFFPKGVNIDLVLGGTPEDGVRYRCFERGVNRETGACGTGALAVAYAWKELSCEECDMVRVQPQGAGNGGYIVRWGDGGMRLCGTPRFLGRVTS